MLGHRPRRPLRGIRWRALQSLGDQRLDLLVAHHSRPTGTGLVEQPVEAIDNKPVAPSPHRGDRQTQPLGQFSIGSAIGGRQHNSRTHGQTRGTRATPYPALQLGPLVSGQHNLGSMRRRHNPV